MTVKVLMKIRVPFLFFLEQEIRKYSYFNKLLKQHFFTPWVKLLTLISLHLHITSWDLDKVFHTFLCALAFFQHTCTSSAKCQPSGCHPLLCEDCQVLVSDSALGLTASATRLHWRGSWDTSRPLCSAVVLMVTVFMNLTTKTNNETKTSQAQSVYDF